MLNGKPNWSNIRAALYIVVLIAAMATGWATLRADVSANTRDIEEGNEERKDVILLLTEVQVQIRGLEVGQGNMQSQLAIIQRELGDLRQRLSE
ncbi:MAG TPA: hypothetical protein VMW24_24835 [Sedimentisphaerales bacterium]|nr:hypothetical protein [Sedimentisphaerales bacterium]